MDFKTKDIFHKWKVMIFKRLRQRFHFKFESISDFDESEHFLLALKSKAMHEYKKMHGGMNATNIYI
jgi:hypothetical protein